MGAASAGWHVWGGPAHWCGALAFALVILVETGREPIDNPDTHLELTMIHEGPLLEYAGRDLALLAWAGAARHWGSSCSAQSSTSPIRATSPARWRRWPPGGRDLLRSALIETAQAKMRILCVPALLGVGCAVALAGAGMWIAGVGA